MDCPICFTEISATTGQVVTACGHSFHFRCLASWFVSQEGASSCPCCRREMSHHEDLPTTEEVGGDESDDEDDEEGEALEEELHRLLDMRREQIISSWKKDDGSSQWRCFLALNIRGHEPIPLFPVDAIFIKGESLAAKIYAVNESLAGIKRFQALWRGHAVRARSV